MTPPPEPPGPDAPPQSRTKQVVATIVTVATLAVVFGGILPQLADYGAAWDAIAAMSTASLVVLVLVTVANVIVYVWPYQAALPGIAFGPAFVVRQTSFAISNGVPAGGAFGLGVQYTMLGEYGVGAGPAAAAIGITGLWNTLVTLSLPVLAVVGLVLSGDPEPRVIAAAAVGIVAVGVVLGVLVLLFRSESAARRLGEFVDGVIGRAAGLVRREVHPRVTPALLEFRGSTITVVRQRAAQITVSNVAQQLVQFIVLFVALRAIQSGADVRTTLVETLVAFSVGRLGSFIPLTPGGLGTVDALITAILVAFGADEGDALAATLLWRASTFFPQVFLGVGTFLFWRRRRGRVVD